jgi:hypothetical protein
MYIFLYDSYVKYGSAGKCRWKFQCKFRNERVPSRQTIHNLVNKLRTTWLSIDKKQKHKHWVFTEEQLDDIGARLEHTLGKSLKHLAQETGVSKSSARTAAQLLKPSSEIWCLVCCKCKKDCCACHFFTKQLTACREDTISNTSCDLWIVTTSFRTLSAVRHACSSAKFVCGSQQAEHRPPWSAEPWSRSTHKNPPCTP